MAAGREIAVVLLVSGCLVCSLLVSRYRVTRSLWFALIVGGVVRIVVAMLAAGITPADVAVHFHLAALQVESGRDPALTLGDHQWNFLPLMPYLWAAMLKTGLSWTILMKVLPIASDEVNILLVGSLCPRPDRSATVRLAYALNPVAILVTSFHGQVEPTALMFLMGGMLLFQRGFGVTAGALFGLAVAAKTWPVIVVLALLAVTPRRALRPVASMVAVLAVFALSSHLFLDAPLHALFHSLSSYSSFSGYWGWAGAMVSAGHRGAEGYGSSVAPVGTVLAVLAVVAAIALFRHASAVRRAWTALVAVLVVSSGFGTQYLMWPTPFLNAGDEHQGLFLTSATGYALAAYLPAFASGDVRLGFLAGLSWLVIAAMAQMLYRAWRETTGGATPDEAGSRPIPAHRKATGRPMRRA